MRFATLNKSRRSRDRALVIQIADKVQELFREKLHGTVANLATATTGRKITKGAVQKWLETAPPYKKSRQKSKKFIRTSQLP
jgi:hypothetical protein